MPKRSRFSARRWRSTRGPWAPTTPTRPRASTTWRWCSGTRADTRRPSRFSAEALAIRELALGPDHPDTAESLNNLALVLWVQGQYAEAEPLFHRAVAIAREIGDRWSEGNALGNLGTAYAALGQAERAIGLYEQARGSSGPQPGLRPVPGERGQRPAGPGQAGRGAQANLEAAVALHSQARAIVPPGSPDFAQCLGNEGNARRDLAKLGVAPQANLEAAVALTQPEARAIVPPDSPDFAQCLMNEGNARQDLAELGMARRDHMEAAIELYEQALQIGQEIKDSRIVQIASSNLERLRSGGGRLQRGNGGGW